MQTTRTQTSILAILAISVLLVLSGCDRPQATAPALRAEIGKPAPDFNLKDTQGRFWTLSELRGKVVFINFWATWCPPCREEMPSMENLNRQLSGKAFQMLTVLNNDDPELADKFVSKVGGTFPVLVDADGRLAAAYGLTGVPETFIVDVDGVLREKFLGPRPWDSQGALDMLGKYLP